MHLSKRTLRQIENLSNICKIDIDNQIVLVPLHYETPEELLDMHLSCPGTPVVSDDTIDYLCDLVSSIPKEFTVEFELKIDDYGEYDHESLIRALHATIENTYYYHDDNHRRNDVLAVIFIILGILILALETIGGDAGWYGVKNSISRNMVETILEIMVWVFIWEGAALLFLTYETESSIFSRNMRRFNGMKFMDNSGKMLSSLDKDTFYKDWIYISKRDTFARHFILFSNAALLAFLSINTVEFFSVIEKITLPHMLFFALSWILIVLLVLSNISFYRESGNLRRFAQLLSIVSLCLSLLGFIFSLVQTTKIPKNIILFGLLTVVLVINIFCLRHLHKQDVEIKN